MTGTEMGSAAIDTAPKFDHWCIVELFGHKKLSGHVTEQVIAGATMLRIDVPETSHRQGYTKYFGASAVYGITPCEEALARRAAEQIERDTDPIPVYIPAQRQLPAGVTSPAEAEDDLWDDDDQGPF